MNLDHYEEYDEDDFCGRFIDHLDSMDTLVGSSSNVASTSYLLRLVRVGTNVASVGLVKGF